MPSRPTALPRSSTSPRSDGEALVYPGGMMPQRSRRGPAFIEIVVILALLLTLISLVMRAH